MNSWRAGCVETRTSGSEGGLRKRIARKRRHRASVRPYSSTHSTTVPSGGCRYNLTPSASLASNCGSAENLNVSSRHRLGPPMPPDPRDLGEVQADPAASSRDDQL